MKIRISSFFLLINVLFLVACHKKDTVWQSDWSTPLLNDTLSLKLLKNSSINTDSQQITHLTLDKNLLQLSINDLVALPDTTFKSSFAIAFDALDVQPGTKYINPSQIDEKNLTIPNVQLKQARISSGKINFKLKNAINTLTYFTIKLPGVTKNGHTFEETFAAPAGTKTNLGIIETAIDVTGYQLDLTGVSGGKNNIIQSLVAVQTDPNGTMVTVTKQDITYFEATMQGIKIDYAKGFFGTQLIQDKLQTQIESLKKIVESTIQFQNAKVQLKISNGMKIPISAQLNSIQNTNSQGNKSDLNHTIIGNSITIDPAIGQWNNFTPSEKVIEFNPGNSNIDAFLSNLGNSIDLNYAITLNPWGNNNGGGNEIFPNSSFKIELNIDIPLKFSLSTLKIEDTLAINLSQNWKKTHAKSGELNLKVNNSFPFNLIAKLKFLDENNMPLFEITPNDTILSSTYGNFNNQGIKVKTSTLNFVMNEQKMYLLNSAKKIIYTSEIIHSGLIPIQLKFDDFLWIQLRAKSIIETRY